MKKEKIFFLYLRTGGGHLAPARSVANYLQHTYPDTYDMELVNAAEEMPAFFRYSLEDGYRILQANAKWYYEFLYLTNKFKPIAHWNRMLMQFFTQPYLERRILTEKPDKIVVFHFFCYEPVFAILKKHGLKIPVITAVTDPYTAHPLWFLRKIQNFIIFSERLKQHCLLLGIPAKNLSVFPFILDEKFTKPADKEQVATLRSKHQLAPQDRMILLLGGGDGIPKGYELLTTLVQSGIQQPITIVCGRNTRLLEQCTAFVNKHQLAHIKVYGYVDFVYELLNICDIVVTKCGASTFMEIIHTRKIPIIIDYLWEQEKGNVDYLVDNKMGIYEPEVSKIPAIIKELFSNTSNYQQYINNMEKAGLRNGTADVSEFIRNFKDSTPM